MTVMPNNDNFLVGETVAPQETRGGVRLQQYIAPNAIVVNICCHGILCASSTHIDTTPSEPRNAALCPYNKKWCRDKQTAFDEWHATIKYMAKNNVNRTFITTGNMFTKCPNGFSELCSGCKERQR